LIVPTASRRASPDATRAYADRHVPSLGAAAFRPLGRTGWSASALGFGAYRVDDTHLAYRNALTHALSHGVNLIDTSSNYTDGGSETLIGAVLGNGGGPGLPEREAVILVSKVGYVQGQNMQVAKAAGAEGHPFPDLVEYHPQCWHCIHPLFLEDQLERSLKRLQAEALDVYLLHNPEYFFADWTHRNPGGDVEAARREFYRRCQAAFEWMEQQVSAGRVTWYGVSSNSFGQPAHHPEFVSLRKLLDAATAAAGIVRGPGQASHLAVVQCPLNLFEPGPALERNQPDGNTFLDLARRAGLGVLVNRPLNALTHGQLTRLASFPALRPEWQQELSAALDRQEAMEREFAAQFRSAIADKLPPGAQPLDPFYWSGAFRNLPHDLRQQEAWMQVLHGTVYPQIERNAQAVMGGLPEGPARQNFADWFKAYAQAVEASAKLLGEGLGRYQAEASHAIQSRLAPLLPPALRDRPLSQQALQVLLSLPGVACVLNGIRQVSYVDDSLGAVTLPALPPEQALDVLRRMRD
jgi:hypothetical protein